jgi:hypothetical protein
MTSRRAQARCSAPEQARLAASSADRAAVTRRAIGSARSRAETLNQSRPTRAKSAPVRARIVRFQAVNSGFAVLHAAAINRPNPAQRCGKRLRKAKNPGAGKRRDFPGGGISRPVHSTALPPFHARKQEG